MQVCEQTVARLRPCVLESMAEEPLSKSETCNPKLLVMMQLTAPGVCAHCLDGLSAEKISIWGLMQYPILTDKCCGGSSRMWDCENQQSFNCRQDDGLGDHEDHQMLSYIKSHYCDESVCHKDKCKYKLKWMSWR